VSSADAASLPFPRAPGSMAELARPRSSHGCVRTQGDDEPPTRQLGARGARGAAPALGGGAAQPIGPTRLAC
jgi:hypothetical protein